MRVFLAGLDCETNTFSNIPTTHAAFEQCGLWRGGAADAPCWFAPVPATIEKLCREQGFDYVEGLFAAAQPAGPVVGAVYAALREEILEAVHKRGPFDVILLHLHGAMVADSCDDCEGDLLARMRGAAPAGTIIGALLDPHAHLSQAMVRNADVLVACKHFPHDDYAERAADLFCICIRTARQACSPKPALFDCRMIGLFPTTEAPMQDIVQTLYDAERIPGILTASFIHGFPWGDTPDTGAKMLVYADRDAELAERTARALGLGVYAQRDAMLPRTTPVDAAIAAALICPGLNILVDSADNAGGGAPGDNVEVLAALLGAGARSSAFGAVWDPQVAQLCAEAGVGARLSLRLGGKTNSSSGQPLDVIGHVCAVRFDHSQGGLGDTRQAMGLCVCLRVDEVDIVVSTVRSQVFAPDLFTELGIDLTTKSIVALKSTNHFYKRFSPLAARIIRLASEGALTTDFASIPYEKHQRPFHPRISDPLGLTGSLMTTL